MPSDIQWTNQGAMIYLAVRKHIILGLGMKYHSFEHTVPNLKNSMHTQSELRDSSKP